MQDPITINDVIDLIEEWGEHQALRYEVDPSLVENRELRDLVWDYVTVADDIDSFLLPYRQERWSKQ